MLAERKVDSDWGVRSLAETLEVEAGRVLEDSVVAGGLWGW